MPVIVRCANPSCGKAATVAEEWVGRTARCKACGKPFVLRPTVEGSAGDTASQAQVRPAPPAEQPTAVGRFQVREQLGAGAFGVVYRAYDPQLDREVAVKVPLPGVLDSPKRVERFLREARAAARLRHPNIVPVYEAGRAGDTYFIATALIKGRPLGDAVDDGGLPFRRAARIVRGLAAALAYAHAEGVVHRDVKPANVILGDDDQPHVMDFGLAARQDETSKLTVDGALVGTPSYMAPEQAVGGRGEPKPTADQYSLGVVLYELLTGRTPFHGPPPVVVYNALHTAPPPPRSVRPDTPPDLEAICLKALAKSPEGRYPDCAALADDLGRWLAVRPVAARRPGGGERLVRAVRRRPAAAALSAGLAVSVAVAAGLALRSAGRQLPAPLAPVRLAPVTVAAEPVAKEAGGRGPVALAAATVTVAPRPASAGPDEFVGPPERTAAEWLIRARTRLAHGDREGALADCSRALRPEPRNAEAALARAALYRLMERWDDAVRDYSAVLDWEPSPLVCFMAVYGRGLAHQGAKRHAQAIADLTTAIDLDPARAGYCLFARSRSHAQLGNLADARKDIDQAVTIGSAAYDRDAKWVPVEWFNLRAQIYRRLSAAEPAAR